MGLGDLLKTFPFVLATRIEYGPGIITKLPEKVRSCGGARVLIVTDPGVLKAGLVDPAVNLLQGAGFHVGVFSEVEANPRASTVDRAAAAAEVAGVDLIVAIGGGSSMDAAKGIAAVLSHGGSIYDYEGLDKLDHAVTPVIAVPTTAGTGSEVTFWAVITDPVRKIKMAVGSMLLAPRVALVDPQLTLTLPPGITAATGMDALTHAIESYTARCANPVSDALALYAMEFIGKNLPTAVEAGKDLAARSGMLLGSLLAGISFGNSDTGAVHSMAEALGAMYDVPHGVANAIFLPYVMAYNLPDVPERTARIGLAMGVSGNNDLSQTARLTIEYVAGLNRQFKIPSLREIGVQRVDLEALAEKADQNLGTPDNAKEIDRSAFLELFRQAYADENPI